MFATQPVYNATRAAHTLRWDQHSPLYHLILADMVRVSGGICFLSSMHILLIIKFAINIIVYIFGRKLHIRD